MFQVETVTQCVFVCGSLRVFEGVSREFSKGGKGNCVFETKGNAGNASVHPRKEVFLPSNSNEQRKE